MTTDEYAVDVAHLTKRFGDLVAVNDVSIAVPSGSVFAFLGTNGAGKSTTIACLTTTLPPDSGTALVAGADVREAGDTVRRRIGVVFQESLLDPAMTVRENLAVRGRLYLSNAKSIARRIGELSDLVELGEFLGRRYGVLSGGQRRRVDIARALLHQPRILFLDEPTAGLDPASRAVVWSTLHELHERGGVTIFLTTHYMEETEEADRVCVIDAGRVIADGTPAELRARHSHSILTVRTVDRGALLGIVAQAGAKLIEAGDVAHIPVDGADTALAILSAHGAAVVDFEFRHGRMDDVFLALTRRQPTPQAA